MENAVKQIDVKQYRLSIYYDIDAENPREMDNIGTMVCWHSRYKLGDENPQDTCTCWANKMADFNDDESMSGKQAEHIVWKRIHSKHVILPLFLYDHSGLCISTKAFSCPWDSGQVGWIYVSKKKAKDELVDVSKKNIERILREEIETYNQFLSGDVYYFVVEKKETCSLGHAHWTQVESCGGFYGQDWKNNGLIDNLGDFEKMFKRRLLG